MGGIVIAIVIFVMIGVGASFAQEAARKKKQAEAESAMKKFDEKEELKKFVESKPNTTVAQRPQTSRPQTTASSSSSNTQSAQARLASRLQQLQKIESEIQSRGHHDDEYCSVNHEATGKYRVEKVPVMNSIGGKSTEGCQDHYDVRFVKLDEQIEKQRELTDLQKVIVYGEVINQPAFKRNYRR
ncbi:MAG: hypothetical protein K2H36_00125 [Clostridia bacterium]|nr:hypothetical protein [Clostridia bacterium]